MSLRATFKLVGQICSEFQTFTGASREVAASLLQKLVSYIVHRFRCYEIRQKMLNVKSAQEWEDYAKLLDQLEGLNEWKLRPESKFYDYRRIESRLLMMKQLRKSGNIKTLVHCLRQDLMKNIGTISDPQLYTQCHYGTKRLIEKYHNEVIKCI